MRETSMRLPSCIILYMISGWDGGGIMETSMKSVAQRRPAGPSRGWDCNWDSPGAWTKSCTSAAGPMSGLLCKLGDLSAPKKGGGAKKIEDSFFFKIFTLLLDPFFPRKIPSNLFWPFSFGVSYLLPPLPLPGDYKEACPRVLPARTRPKNANTLSARTRGF